MILLSLCGQAAKGPSRSSGDVSLDDASEFHAGEPPRKKTR